MKRLLLAAALGLTTLTANAVCPQSLSGKYSGSGQYTEQQFINGVSVISYIEYHVVSVSISNGYLTVLTEYYAATGANGPAAADAVGSTPFSFDKTTCNGLLGNAKNPLFFVVSNSGDHIRFIHGKTPNDKHLSAELWELDKQ